MIECPLVVNIQKRLQTPFGDAYCGDDLESALICKKRKPFTNGYMSAWNTPHEWCEQFKVSGNCFKSCFHQSSAGLHVLKWKSPQVTQMAPEPFMIPPATAQILSSGPLAFSPALPTAFPLEPVQRPWNELGLMALWCREFGEQATERSKWTPHCLKPGVVGRWANLWSFCQLERAAKI